MAALRHICGVYEKIVFFYVLNLSCFHIFKFSNFMCFISHLLLIVFFVLLMLFCVADCFLFLFVVVVVVVDFQFSMFCNYSGFPFVRCFLFLCSRFKHMDIFCC